MRKWWRFGSLEYFAQKRRIEGLQSSGRDLNRKCWIALTLYCVLAILDWFAVGSGKVLVNGKPVELRLVPLIILGGLALRTVLAQQADRIRRGRG